MSDLIGKIFLSLLLFGGIVSMALVCAVFNAEVATTIVEHIVSLLVLQTLTIPVAFGIVNVFKEY